MTFFAKFKSDCCASIHNNLLYFATLSDLQGAPVLIWPVPSPTQRSAIVLSSVSPDLCEIIDLYAAEVAHSIALIVSVKLPTWLNLINIAFAISSLIPYLKFLYLLRISHLQLIDIYFQFFLLKVSNHQYHFHPCRLQLK